MNAQVAIVAGAGGPLGHATIAALADGGLTIVAVDRNEEELRDLPASVRREVADATDPAAAKSLVNRIAAEAGPPNRASLPDEVIAHAVAPDAIAGVIAFLVSDAAAPVSGAILPAYGA